MRFRFRFFFFCYCTLFLKKRTCKVRKDSGVVSELLSGSQTHQTLVTFKSQQSSAVGYYLPHWKVKNFANAPRYKRMHRKTETITKMTAYNSRRCPSVQQLALKQTESCPETAATRFSAWTPITNKPSNQQVS